MKHYLIICLLFCSTLAQSQSEEQAVKQTVNDFFTYLGTQDTVLLKEIVYIEGQLWTVNNFNEPSRIRNRFFKDDMGTFNPESRLREVPKSFDIKIHNGLAMAWVPYEFYVNDEFSHCGVDIFTLVKTEDRWKIANCSYTLEKEGCK
jgi:hypothetical protein